MKTAVRRRTRGWAAALMAACLLGGGVTLAPAAQADSTPAGSAIPPHVFAPYYYSNSPTDNLLTVSTASTANYLTLAFLQTKAPGDCTVFWNGRNDSPVGPTYAAGIAAIRAAGGDVFPSFGGAAAGSLGTELADSCTDVNAIADEFKRVITAYNFTRIDLDVEEGALTEAGKAGVDRRNKAIKIVQDWAAAEGRVIEFVYTQPTWTTGLNDGSMYLIQNAIDNGARIDGVNIMTFDYYDEVSDACKAGTGPAHDMAASTIAAATSLYGILHNFYPEKTPAQLWGMIGVIEMPGNSDFGKCEEFKIQDATTVLNWAVEKNILAISFWSIQRDTKNRGGSPVVYGFSKIFSQFTHWDNQNQTVISASVLGGTLSMSVSSTAPIVLPALPPQRRQPGPHQRHERRAGRERPGHQRRMEPDGPGQRLPRDVHREPDPRREPRLGADRVRGGGPARPGAQRSGTGGRRRCGEGPRRRPVDRTDALPGGDGHQRGELRLRRRAEPRCAVQHADRHLQRRAHPDADLAGAKGSGNGRMPGAVSTTPPASPSARRDTPRGRVSLTAAMQGQTGEGGDGVTEWTAVTGTPSLLRSLNDRTTLGLLLDRGVLSRSEVSAASGLSKPTAAQSLQRLHELGLVAVVGSRPGRPGPAAQLFEVDPVAGYAIGIDVADRRVRIRVCNASGAVLAEGAADPGGRDVVRVLSGLYATATRDLPTPPEAARCVVVGVSGSYDSAADTVRHAGHLAPTTSGLDRPRLAERIGDALGADVTIESDVKLVAVAEHHIGAATDVRTSVLLWAQGGVGAAAVIDGRVHRGVTGSAGELGYLPVPGVPLTSGDNPQGGFQQWAGGDAVTGIGLRHGLSGSAEQMIRVAAAEPATGDAFLSELADRYATGIAALVAILDPELVVLSGSFFTAGGAELTSRVAQSVARQAMRPVPVVLGALGDHPVLTGATHLAARRLRDALLDRIGPAAATLAR